MTNLIVEISKYLMIFLMALYTFFNFRFFSFHDEGRRMRVCAWQSRAMLLIHALAYMVIYLKTEQGAAGTGAGGEAILSFYIAQVVFFIAYTYVYRLLYRNLSRLLVNNACMLLCVSFIMLTRISPDKAVRQFVIVVIAAVATWTVPFIVERVWQLYKLPWVYAGVGLALLFAVFAAGNTNFGAQLSLTVGGVSIQPSEFVKITFVLFVAAMFYKSTSLATVALVTATAALHVAILVASRDLGGGLLFFVTYLFMVFAATSNWLYLGLGCAGGAFAATAAYRLFAHVRVRVSAWLNPWADIENKGYQITQSLFAIGTGGWFGMGLYQGMPFKIPVVEKDFIFSAVSEELGGIFALCVLLICLGCFLQFMMIASRMQAVFYKQVALGLGTMYIVQVFLTVGGVTKFIPSTGVTLPFVSYGGSSIASTFILFGILQGIYILKRNDEEAYEKK